MLKIKHNFGKRFAAFVIAIVIAVPGTYFVLNSVTNNICEITGIRITEESFLPETSKTEEKPIKESEGMAAELEATTDRLFKGIGDGNSFSSGRAQIWYTYLTNLSFKGHAPNHLTFYYDGQELQANSHNAFLHISYQSGILPGVAFVTIVTMMTIASFRSVISQSVSKESLFMACVMANALPYMILANTIGPYTAFPLIAFWIIVVPSFSSIKKRSDVKGIKKFLVSFFGR